jgi:acyl carrier protein
MDRATIFTDVQAILVKTFNAEADDITLATSSDNIDGWDSLSHTLLMMSLEAKFKVKIPMDQMFFLRSVGAIVDYLYTHPQSS